MCIFNLKLSGKDFIFGLIGTWMSLKDYSEISFGLNLEMKMTISFS